MTAQSPSDLPHLFATNLTITPPSTFFPTPSTLTSHLDSGASFPSTLTISIGTDTHATLFQLLSPNYNSPHHADVRAEYLRTEIRSWADVLVRMTKVPDFNVHQLTLDMCPQKMTDRLYDFYALLTRASAAIQRAERRVGGGGGGGGGGEEEKEKKESCVVVVKGWVEREGGCEADLEKCCVGVRFVAVETVKMVRN